MQGFLCDGFRDVTTPSEKTQVNTLKITLLWLAGVGTALILADDLIALYKVFEFRAAIHDQHDFALVIGLFVAVGVSASLLFIPLISLLGHPRPDATNVKSYCIIAAVCAAGVLLLNTATMADWPTQTLEGRGYSAVWCLVVAVLCIAGVPRRS